MRYLVYSIFCLIFTSCSFQNVEFLKMNGVQMKGVEGRKYSFDLGAQLDNPNKFNIKLKKADLDVYSGDQYLGKLILDKKVKLKKKSINDATFPINFNLEEGGLWSLLRLMKQEEVEVQFKGQVKGGVFLFSKKLDIDERKTIPTKGLKLNP